MKNKVLYSAIVCVLAMSFACEEQGSDLGDLAVSETEAALLAPDQDLSDFPPWIWPVIHPVDILANVVTGRELDFKQAAGLVKLSVSKFCECNQEGNYSFDQLLEMVDSTLGMQYYALNFAKTKAVGIDGKRSVNYWDDDDWCGTPPKPWPWPWPWMELIYFEADVLVSEMSRSFDLSQRQIAILEGRIGEHLKRFESLAK